MLRPTAFALTLVSIPVLTAEVADPSVHPYADPAGGRDHYALAGETVNEERLYDFYHRQADYYMARPSAEVPDLLPAYPGLDAGGHGHWGKHNQNNHGDGRWNQVDHGPILAHVLRAPEITVLKALCLKLPPPGKRGGEREDPQVTVAFDTQSLSQRAIWQGGFVTFHPHRWGGSRNAAPKGELWYQDKVAKGWDGDRKGRFLGWYRSSRGVILSYRIGEIEILDHTRLGPTTRPVLFRTLQFPKGVPEDGLRLRLGIGLAGSVQHSTNARLESDADDVTWLEIGAQKNDSVLSLVLSQSPAVKVGLSSPFRKLTPLEKGGHRAFRRNFPAKMQVTGQLAGEDDERPYVVDSIPVPFDNPYRTVMQLTGIAFLPGGDALVTVWCGEVWRVSFLGDDIHNVQWRRVATGFNQPLGIHIDEDGIFVMDRGRITRLHDYNGDGEIDFYENYADDFGGYNGSHTHTFGLIRTPDKAFHFVQREAVLRTSPSPKTDLEAFGVRNCIGAGLWDGRYMIAPQEGNWTPASMIIEVRNGEFYGHGDGTTGDREIAAPLCYIPRGVENSTGGMVQATSDKWGPLQGGFIGLSYGSGIHYLILRDDSGPRPQGATVPLDGEFRAGAMRGAFSPRDGQLYVAGLDGWGDYSTQDGCLHRVRYTGKPVRVPIGFQVHSNGVRIDFTCELDRAEAENLSNYFAQQWNYLYSDQYGSPEYSVRNPDTVGHDRVHLRSVRLLEGGKSIFVEIPELVPSMQMQIRMHLTDAHGATFKTNLFPSILYLGDHFAAEGLAPPVPNKLTVINLPIKRKESAEKHTESGPELRGARELVVEVLGGLQFKQKELTARAGEALALKLLNTDIMPHNLVLVAPGKAQEVGMTAFKMLNDPRASEKHYVPDLPSVLAHTFVVPAGGSHLTRFRAPSQPGRYPFLCTFPGHWQAMQGVLVVE